MIVIVADVALLFRRSDSSGSVADYPPAYQSEIVKDLPSPRNKKVAVYSRARDLVVLCIFDEASC